MLIFPAILVRLPGLLLLITHVCILFLVITLPFDLHFLGLALFYTQCGYILACKCKDVSTPRELEELYDMYLQTSQSLPLVESSSSFRNLLPAIKVTIDAIYAIDE